MATCEFYNGLEERFWKIADIPAEFVTVEDGIISTEVIHPIYGSSECRINGRNDALIGLGKTHSRVVGQCYASGYMVANEKQF